MPKNLALTSKNRIACEYILEGLSVKNAMIKAGYGEVYAVKHACRFLKHRKIIEYLRKRQEEIAHAHTIDLNYVLRKLDEIVSKNGVEEKDKVAALKVVKEALNERKELDIKLKAIEASKDVKELIDTNPIVIKIEQATKDA